ncbi:MAG TPA: S41 family peptidase [Vicinamibacterales bacterium]|jgi:carboxyl-terminal processing protease|nr:S41 family peptidase [Vicinamibacterales bacterium]
MSSRTRLIVMSISAPVIAFAIVGGFLGKVMAGQDAPYQHLKIFDDVVTMISSQYVEEVNIDKVMSGAMHGLADGLDPDSAYLTPAQVKQVEAGTPLPPAGVGLELTRQYYLRVIAARDNSPAAKAGLRTGDYIRAINDLPTREMSVWEGMRMLRGAAGTKVTVTVIRGNAADPHVVELVRQAEPPSVVTGRVAAPGVGYIRIAGISKDTAEQVKTHAADAVKNGATKLIVDVRRVSNGSPEDGLAVARLFVAKGTLAMRETKSGPRETIASAAGDGSITLPAVVLIDTGTSAAAEVFASALSGNKRADLIGEHTIGRAAEQKLIKLPDGAGLWLSTMRYLTPAGTPLHEKGLEPTVVVDDPDVEFGQPAPTADPILEKALEHLADKKAA